jgi:hypothetical protein
MDSEALLTRLRKFMTIEQEFYHKKFMMKARMIDDIDELREILDLLHSNFLVRKNLFEALAKRVADDGYELPEISELIEKK